MPPLVLAIAKGRISDDVIPLLQQADCKIEPDFFDHKSRKLRFQTSWPDLDIVRVRAFDVPMFVACGGANLGLAGSDAIAELNSDKNLEVADLGVGKCDLALAGLASDQADYRSRYHLRVATKYPNITNQFFTQEKISADIIKLNGAMELGPLLGMCDYIVDLVSTGKTLQENNLRLIKKIKPISTRLIINSDCWYDHNKVAVNLIAKLRACIKTHGIT
jgi:ATP phosphoribosyltransferase